MGLLQGAPFRWAASPRVLLGGIWLPGGPSFISRNASEGVAEVKFLPQL